MTETLDVQPMAPFEEEAWNFLDRKLNGDNAIITRVDHNGPIRGQDTRLQSTRSREQHVPQG